MKSSPVELILSKLPSVRPAGEGQWLSRCPVHNDAKASLSIGVGDDGRALLRCHAGCCTPDIVAAIGLKMADLMPNGDGVAPTKAPVKRKKIYPTARAAVEALEQSRGPRSAAWTYKDADGKPVGVVVRWNLPGGGKNILPVSRNGAGWSQCGMPAPRPLLCLPELADATQIVIVEGEKVVSAARAISLDATTSAHGAGSASKTDWSACAGKECIILPDNNDAGRKYAASVARLLYELDPRPTIKIVPLPGLADGDDGNDLVDWLASGGTREELDRLVEQAPEWKPSAAASNAKEPVLTDSSADGSAEPKAEGKAQGEWETPIPLLDSSRPTFPLPNGDDQFCGFWEYCARVSESIQTPFDLPAMLCLTVASAAISKKAVMHVRGDHRESLNIFACVVLDPAHRKSAVFAEVAKPLLDYEAAEQDRLNLLVEENQNDLEILDKSLKHVQGQAAKCNNSTERSVLSAEAKELVKEIAAFKNSKLLTLPTLVVDDVTPEALTRILNDNGGKTAIMSAEGGLFSMMAGRYSDSKAPNLDVYLKGHVGDTIKIHRIGRPDEYVRNPALAIALTVQYDVLRSLSVHPSFRGRGLLGRFFYSLPHSSLGHRQLNPRMIPEFVRQQYQSVIRDVLKMDFRRDDDGKASPWVFTFAPEAQTIFDTFSLEVEASLADGGEFEHMRDWAGKLVGGVARIAGVLHGLQFARSMAHVGCEIDKPTTAYSIAIGRYLAHHAKAAYGEIGADPEIALAKKLLARLRCEGLKEFTKRAAFQWVRGAVSKAEELDRPLAILMSHGHIRRVPAEKAVGRPSERYEVNPLGAISSISSKVSSSVRQ